MNKAYNLQIAKRTQSSRVSYKVAPDATCMATFVTDSLRRHFQIIVSL